MDAARLLSALKRLRGNGRRVFDPPARGYAVVDLETTGLSWRDGDRVVEIAVMTLDSVGTPTGCWATLVRPDRDVGSSHIHGITDRDLLHAPQFPDLLPLLAASLRGRVLAAHSLPFDAAFLRQELLLAGHDVGLTSDAGLCTRQLAEHYLPYATGDLGSLAYTSGIPVRFRHWALWDAEVAARLLRLYIRTDTAFARHWHAEIRRSLELVWPEVEAHDPILLPRCPPVDDPQSDDWCALCTWPPASVPPLPSPHLGRGGRI
jgi:DNA polymerase-3 subunit epsilon